MYLHSLEFLLIKVIDLVALRLGALPIKIKFIQIFVLLLSFIFVAHFRFLQVICSFVLLACLASLKFLLLVHELLTRATKVQRTLDIIGKILSFRHVFFLPCHILRVHLFLTVFAGVGKTANFSKIMMLYEGAYLRFVNLLNLLILIDLVKVDVLAQPVRQELIFRWQLDL